MIVNTKIRQRYFDFLRQQQNTTMLILLINANRLDFVANDNDYHRIIEVIDLPYNIGPHWPVVENKKKPLNERLFCCFV